MSLLRYISENIAYLVVKSARSVMQAEKIQNEKLGAAENETPTAPDLETAYRILSDFGLLIGPAGEKSDVIARAIAVGIGIGRREALAHKGRKRK